MTKKLLTVSDLTDEPILSDEDVVTMIVHDHPKLDHAVTIDAAADEVSGLKASKKDFVLIELLTDGGDSRERMVIELAAFEKLFKTDAAEVLADAEHYNYGGKAPQEPEPKRRGRPAGSTNTAKKATKTDYTSAEHFGEKHRGRVTEEEAYAVRQNPEQANKNRVAQGHPPINWDDETEQKRYGITKANMPQFTAAQ